MAELIYRSPVFSVEVVVKTRGIINIEREDNTGTYGNVPLEMPMPGVLNVAQACLIKDELTLELANTMNWDIRRLLSRDFVTEDKELNFMYLLDNRILVEKIKEGIYKPVYLKHFNTSDLE